MTNKESDDVTELRGQNRVFIAIVVAVVVVGISNVDNIVVAVVTEVIRENKRNYGEATV